MIATDIRPDDFAAMRTAMVASQLRTTAVSDVRVVAAMAEVPRELFVPDEAAPLAYRDREVPLGQGRSLNPPLATGRLLTEAQLHPADRVLLIGAASGYTAAVLARLVANVVAVEVDPALVARARLRLGGDVKVQLVEGPLEKGHAAGAPYDVLIVDGAVEQLSPSLPTQVKDGGRIVTGLVDRGVCRLASGAHVPGAFGLTTFADLDCVILPGFSAPSRFTF